MSLASRLALPLLLLAAFGCREPQGPPPPEPLPDATLVYDGRIYLGAPDWRAVDALLVHDGRVVAAGGVKRLEAMAQGKSLRTLKLGGAVALPGLQDAHGHLEGLGAALESVDLRGVASYDALIDLVAAQAARQPPGTWVEGRGWDQNLWPDPAFPDHAALSARVPDHPVLLTRVDGHAALVNAAALHVAGLDGEGVAEDVVAGGRVLVDERGRATGVLIDAAVELVSGHLPAPSDAVRVRRILRAQERLLAVGLTAVHDMGVDLATVLLLEQLRAEGRLRLRVVAYLSGNDRLTPQMLEGFPLPPDHGDVLAVAGVKLYADGALGSRGAALLEDYADDPGDRGLTLLTQEQLRDRLAVCAAAGMQPAIHAIGDRANRMVLDAIEEQERRTPAFAALRPRVEHAQVVAPADWSRFAALGVVPSMQPTHCTSDMPWAPQRLGPGRLAGAYAWRRLAPDPAVLAFGSDFPVEAPDPLPGLWAAVTRRGTDGRPGPRGYPDADQRLDLRAALGAFTAGAARAAHQEGRRGRLAPGYACDLTVLDMDPLTDGAEALLHAHVSMTVINGEVVFARP